MRRDEGVDAPGVGLEHLPVFGAHLGQRAFTNAAEAERAILDVKSQRPFAENFRQLSGDEPAAQIHLPQAVLGRHVPLGKEQIFEGLRAQVRNSALVAENLHWRRKT